jgi:hypothetical protein
VYPWLLAQIDRVMRATSANDWIPSSAMAVAWANRRQLFIM